MKVLFFILTLANVVLIMWEYHKGVFGPSSTTSLDNSKNYQEQVVLVSELASNTLIASQAGKPQLSEESKADQLSKTHRLDEKNSGLDHSSEINPIISERSKQPLVHGGGEIVMKGLVDERSTICYEAGPFASKQIYTTWDARLNGYMKRLNKEEPELKDYLVYYPAGETMIQSQANLQKLKEKGITDLWFFSQGPEQGQISLGVFNKEEKARLMQNELLVKGISAEIRARYKNKAQKFALIRVEGNITDKLDLLKKEYPNVPIKEIDPSASKSCLNEFTE